MTELRDQEPAGHDNGGAGHSGSERPRKPRKPTGIPRRRLDRHKRFVIAYVGHRWEIIGEHLGPVAPWTYPAMAPGGGRGAASTGGATGRNAEPAPETPEGPNGAPR
jgi:hypothetical protein